MYRLRVRESFCAGHFLPGYDGPCATQHGHTWTVEVEVSAKNVGNGGMVVDFADVKKALRDVVVLFDHKNLNDLPDFSTVPPTAENLAILFHRKVSADLSGVTSITIWESPNASVTFEL